ncbi:MAG: class I SAM-dependent methyltransferase, partial [Candidatus Goldbacteria bacterium]|nr:class I SAM-dependent methyltransferase [Candidatus Goldiibacteriota bacterium]
MKIKHQFIKFIDKIFWNSYAYVYDDIAKYYNPYKQLNDFIFNFITSKLKKGIVFDAGCGTGELAIMLARKYRVIAGDFSPVMINKLNNKILKNKIKNISTKIIDLNKKLPFKDKTFDVVVNVHS